MRRLWAVLVVPLLILLSTSSFGCATNPVATALKAKPGDRAETVAFALHNSYVVVAERAATIAEDSTTPHTLKVALVALHEAASPAAKTLRQRALDYQHVREAIDSGGSTPEKLVAALAALNDAIANASPKINALAVEVGGAP